MIRALLPALLLLAVASPAPARPAPGAVPAPRPSQALVDEQFGVGTQRFGLRREVEMAQWRRSGDGYALEWSAEPVDSAGFPARYRNPARFPIASERWEPEVRMEDGRPLAPEALEALGIWRPLAPDPDALPENLAATFRVQGDLLTTAADLAEPAPLDLRVRWFERVLPALAGRVALRDGVWVAVDTAAPAPVAATEQLPGADGEGSLRSYAPWIGGLLLLVAAVLVARHRRRSRRAR
ncbi:hypothetical protein QFW77_15110 [Luteimonas sp. RD2P54]|uniref:DUF3153 domain-containing protein n=1 Tax=Luteimonas endophytica TaxID=3042023 RepID=A0ABT6JBV9_9GAMM|nr:hypothetical protein [Luteimonas endophytica]MDH5824305.1 hypothetical protein [Luteimonas endophytica]